jgi:hypothetical protein
VRTQAVGALGPAGVAGVLGYAGSQIEKILEVPAVQGQVIDHRIRDRTPEFGVGGFDQRDRLGDVHRLGLLAGLQGEVDANLLADLQHHVLALHTLEAFELGANRVSTRKQVGSEVGSGIIGGQRPRDASLDVRDSDRGS